MCKTTETNTASSKWASVIATLLCLISLVLVFPGTGLASSVLLDWDPSTDADLAGYKVYYQANSQNLPFAGTGATEGSAPIDVGKVTTFTVDGLDPNANFYFAVTAYNSTGTESVYSNIIEIKESVPPAVSIISPANASKVSGVVAVQANASDNVGVTRVDFFVNGVQVAEVPSAPFTFSWDTTSLTSGSYTLSAKAYDAAGNAGDSSILSVTVNGDVTPPNVALSAPAPGSAVSGTVNVSASAQDASGVTRLELYLDGTLLLTGNQSTASYSWNTLAVSNGTHTLSAKAYDAAGNVGSSPNLTVTVYNDTTAPTVSVVAPSTGSSLSQTATVLISAGDDVGVTKVDYYLDGVLQASAANLPYNFSWNTLSSANGSHTLSAKAYDAAGNIGQSASVAVTVFNDTTSPTVSITSPGAGSTASLLSTVSVSASDNVGVTRVEYYLNGTLQGTSTTAPYSFSWNTLGNPNGSYTLTAKAYDAAGNVGQSAGVAVTVFNDTTAPTVAIASPGTGSTLSQTATVQVSASDNVGVTKVEYYLNGILQGTATAAPYSFTWNTLSAVNGSYTLTAKAYDAAGNIGSSTPVTVSVFNDLQAPTVGSFTLPANANSTTVAVSGLTASDNVGVTGYLITESATAPSAAATGWKASAPTSFSFAGTGLRTAYAWAKDAAGNVSSAKSASVLIDTTLPTIKSMSLSRSSNSVNVKASATDNVGVTRFQLYLDGVLKTEVASGSLSYTLAVSSGSHTATVKAYDAAGNTRSQSVNFYR